MEKKSLSTEDSVELLEKDLTDNPFRSQLLRFIDVVWTFFDFDVFGYGSFQTVNKGFLKSTSVQILFAFISD